MMKIAVVTTGRADWNGLGMLAGVLRQDGHDIVVLACGQHADSQSALDAMGWPFRVQLVFRRPDQYEKPSPGQSAGYTLIGLSGALERSKPDLAVILGDRYEALLAATAAAINGIPVAHLDGGDETEGSTDNLYRHAITKLASMHFCCTTEHALRVIQMGEDNGRVLMVGSTHVDRLLSTALLDRDKTAAAIGWERDRPFVVVNWQPETAAADPNAGLARILSGLSDGPAVLFVGQNADPGAQEARDMIAQHVAAYYPTTPDSPRWVVENLKPEVYLSALRHCICLIGNSSSAYFEAPYLGCWAVEFGDRQKGRDQPPNVHRIIKSAEGGKGIMKLLDFSSPAPVTQPYGGAGACRRIADALQSIGDLSALRKKRFHAR